MMFFFFFFFQAEDGIRDSVASRGLGDVYKRQALIQPFSKACFANAAIFGENLAKLLTMNSAASSKAVSYTHLTLPTILLV